MAIGYGNDRAYIDLVGMKVEILWLMQNRFPIAMALGTGAQLLLALIMIWYAQGSLKPPTMEDRDAEGLFKQALGDHQTSGVRGRFASPENVGTLAARSPSRSDVSLLKDDNHGSALLPLVARVSVGEDLEMGDMPPR
jgi:hypothetical protein